MLTNIKFGECLKLLLSALDISINRLSRAINVDSSLVSRWTNEKRIPPYNTPYIDGISEYLSNNINNNFQRLRIDELLLNVSEAYESTGSIKEKIKMLLLESQGYSIECKRKEEKKIENHSPTKEQMSKLISKYPNNIINGSTIWDTNSTTQFSDLSSEDKIISGANNILTASTFLLETAAKQKCRNSNTIYITYNNEGFTGSFPYNSLIQWRDALLRAINNGWNVLFLLKLNNNTDRAIKFINFAKPFIQTGKSSFYYLKKYDSFSTGKNLIIVPEIGALSCFPDNLHSEISCAFYLTSLAAIDIFKDYIDMLITTCAKPLVKNYSIEENMDYYHYLAEIEDTIGNQFLYKYSFSVLTLPEKLYEKLLKNKKLPNDEMIKAMDLYKLRLNAFHTNIHNYNHYDIYFADSIKDLIKHHQYSFNSYNGIKLMDLDKQDIIEYLYNIINLLKTYDNYNIAFIPQKIDDPFNSDNFYIMVKERQAVLIESSKDIPELKFSIKEPMIIKAFSDYFKELWEHIAPVNKDKDEVIAWLKSEIDILENECKKIK